MQAMLSDLDETSYTATADGFEYQLSQSDYAAHMTSDDSPYFPPQEASSEQGTAMRRVRLKCNWKDCPYKATDWNDFE